MIMKTEIDLGGKKTISTLVSAKEETSIQRFSTSLRATRNHFAGAQFPAAEAARRRGLRDMLPLIRFHVAATPALLLEHGHSRHPRGRG